jgi:hypothetical protein
LKTQVIAYLSFGSIVDLKSWPTSSWTAKGMHLLTMIITIEKGLSYIESTMLSDSAKESIKAMRSLLNIRNNDY